MRISDWSSDVCSSDLLLLRHPRSVGETYGEHATIAIRFAMGMIGGGVKCLVHAIIPGMFERAASDRVRALHVELEHRRRVAADRSEEHTSELQSLMRISYAVFCLKNKNIQPNNTMTRHQKPITKQ